MNISLEYPWMLALVALPVFVFRIFPVYLQPAASIYLPFFARLVAATGQAPTSGSQVKQRKRIQAVALLLSWLLTIICLARPVLLGEPVITQKTGRDLMVAVDLSQSMEQEDYQLNEQGKVSRLVALKSLLNTFSKQRNGDRLGLIVFGSGAYLQVPFTEDITLWQTLLQQMDTQMAGPATAIGDAIGLSIRAFDGSNTTQRILLLVTDGSDTSSRLDPVDAARVAAAEGIAVFTLGMGSIDTEGEDKVDFNTLNKIAKITKGHAFEGNSTDAIEQVLRQVNEIAPAKYQQQSYLPKLDIYPWLMGPMLIIYICVWLALTISTAVAAKRQAYVK
ncbi:VWA domain-containing protein [Shewanella gelidimarina]|uniref:VWA domain-containing protein n=1 Tax=Shewanella gelidimarina TaxID=56813 RepID=UPI00200F4551|nr:VWA domain-containing protein [Shewanella gelidimarina]MCL1058913.1 VWA domain-containing protein [Shewanella gelidimarina]